MSKNIEKIMIIVNFKQHKKPDELAQKLKRFNILLAVLPKNLKQIAKIKANTYSQYLDKKANTKSVKENRAKGTILNHSDYPISNSNLRKYIHSAKKARLKTVVCCTNAKRASQIALMKPDYIAVEPTELIGGRISVSEARPELITDVIHAVRKASAGKIPVLCGAGIHSKKDVKRAVELGAKGVLVSSAVVKAKNPAKVVREMIEGLR